MTTAIHLQGFLLQNLQSGRWRAGDRLPTERELSEQFQLSRSTVRRVLQKMKDMQVISQQVGSGTYVTEHAASVLSRKAGPDPVRQTSPAELMEARLALEPAIIDMVIGHATAGDFEQMDSCCRMAEAATTLEEFEHWDGLLHQAIADAARNGFVASVFKLMNQARAQGEWGMLKQRSLTPQRRLAYQREHRELVDAIRQRDLARARALCTAHLQHVRRNLLSF